MRRVIFLILLFVFLSLPSFVLADTIVSGQISSDTTWLPAGGVYIIDSSFSVASGTTLTIEPGTIIKAKSTWYGGPSIYGKIIAHGTSDLPIYFTSISDDSIGGDTDGGGPSIGSDNHWQGLYFKQGSEGDFDYVNLSYSGYGGYGYGDYVGIENDGGTLNIKHSNIHNNYIITSNGAGGSMSVGSGIYNKSGTLSVSDSVIDNNMVGIRIDSGTATISNNIFKNHLDSTGYGAGYGVYATGPEPLTLINNTFSNNRKTAFVEASKNFTHSGNTSADQTNRGFEMGGIISEDTTFTSGDLPYIIQRLTISNGKTLTLEPGTILKMNDYYSSGAINVQSGNLIAKGTPEKKIFITSLRDDSIGGDTNGDGDATIPAPKNWNAIYLEAGSKADFDNVVLRYSGYNYNGEYLPGVAAAIYDRGAEFSVLNSIFEHNYGAAIYKDAGTTTISHSEFTNQQMGLWSRGGSITISQSSFLDNTSYGVYNQSGIDLGPWYPTKPMQIIDARNNWWGSVNGPKNISTSTPTGDGDGINENVLYIPFLTEPPSDKPPVQTIDPVIIIPGIAGTELYNGSDLIWLDLSQTATDINDYFLTENLKLNNQGDSVLDILIGNVIKRIQALVVFDINIFEDLSLDLQNKSGYQENQNLFFFPYDWRLDLNTTKNLLKQKIDEVKTQTGKDKVNIIAHSMGGLLVKEYLNSYGKNSVDKLIFVGTPHLGAPKAGKILLEGDRLGIPWLEEDRIKEIAENSPALHELLPNQTYFNQSQGYLRKYSLFGNNSLLNYEETKNFFLNDKNKNSLMFQKVEDFYNQDLDEFDFSGIETYNIAGCKTPTQAAYSFGILGEIGQTGYTSGDGTVPMVSADYINIPSADKFYVKDGSHAELPSANGVRDLILGILNDETDNLANNVSNDSSFCNFKGKKLTWHSPVEIHIYSGGNHTGPIENNAIEYGISGIDYDVMGHNKFIFLPTDGSQEYLVEAIGLEEGSFDLSISEIDNGQYLTTQVFNDVPITISMTASFEVNNLVNNSIELKDGGVTKEVPVDAVLNGELTLDLTPPETTAKADWIKNKKQKKNLQITLTATDNQSGILETAYSLDEGNTFSIYSKPFVVEKKMEEILFYSVDKAGNNEEVKTLDLEKNKSGKCKSWKCLEINKKHDKIKKEYKEIKGHEQEFIKKFKIKKK